MKIFARAFLLAATAALLTAQEPPKAVPADQDYVHRETGVTFPARMPGFTRGNVREFDPQGRDVSAAYGDGNFVATVYSYPLPPRLHDLREVLTDAQAAIQQANPAAKLVREGAGPDGSMRAEYEFTARLRSGEQLVRSHVVVYGKGDWLLKYRVTYPAAEREEGERRMEALIRLLGTEAVRGGKTDRRS